METQFRKVLCSERLPDRHIRHRKISITVPVFDIKDEFLGGDAYNFEFGHWIENQPEFRRGGIVNYWLEEIEAQPKEVLDKCNCPICDSDDVFSFKQTSHKCRSCDYRFTK